MPCSGFLKQDSFIPTGLEQNRKLMKIAVLAIMVAQTKQCKRKVQIRQQHHNLATVLQTLRTHPPDICSCDRMLLPTSWWSKSPVIVLASEDFSRAWKILSRINIFILLGESISSTHCIDSCMSECVYASTYNYKYNMLRFHIWVHQLLKQQFMRQQQKYATL